MREYFKSIKTLIPVYWQLISSREGIVIVTSIMAVVFYDTFYVRFVPKFPNYSMHFFSFIGCSMVIIVSIYGESYDDAYPLSRAWRNGRLYSALGKMVDFFSHSGNFMGVLCFPYSFLSFFLSNVSGCSNFAVSICFV